MERSSKTQQSADDSHLLLAALKAQLEQATSTKQQTDLQDQINAIYAQNMLKYINR